jgi:thiol-disulfide isomerase/thioredoxin
MRHFIVNICSLAALIACSDPTPPSIPNFAPKELTTPTPSAVPTALEDEAPLNDGNSSLDAGIALQAIPVSSSPRRLGRPVLLDFSRDNCLPCDIMRPWVDLLRKKYDGTVEVIEVNIDREENHALGMFFKTRAVPLQVYLDAEGREQARSEGIATLPQMQSNLERLGFLKKNGKYKKSPSHGSSP